ncbi:bile acid 7-alpha dehydratase [Pedobacter frigidisoli]|uniref:Bile acid 7-alpha dehydratase n=1 Tax=Pedobacter frigidisoli TaxID=2530455 RepID=A0A4R0NAQ4_9SPHI|nr:bile acid 7-alpha dehydratase [Pedobacter frigidisoli]TCC97328.1 bile acid 7-alpha dehydratase [Pedobacter frigidisoli]
MEELLKKPQGNTPENLLDKFTIKGLIEFERFCRDNAQWDEMKKCYSADSKVKISWYQGSGPGFVDASSKMKGYAPHKLYDTLVWLNGNRAIAITMATIQVRINVDGNLLELQSEAKLIFRVQKINREWIIAGFEAIYEKDALVPVTPNSSITIPTEEISKFRPSYANLCYALSKEGHPVAQDLPGIDKPEMVAKLYEETEIWLNS